MEEAEVIYSNLNVTNKEVQPLPPPLPKTENIPASFIEVNPSIRIPPPETLTVIPNSCKRCSRNSASRKQVVLAIAVVILAILSTVFVTMYLTTECKGKPCDSQNSLTNKENTSCNCSRVRNCSKFNTSTITWNNTDAKKSVDVGSCEEALKEDGSLSSGIYYLKELSDSAATKYPVYCHMSDIVNCGGAGWTLVLIMDGSKSTFKYDSPYWSDKNTYGYHEGLEGLTDQESKLASYWNTPFKKICLGMKVNGVTKWIKLDYEASSLYSVIANGTFRGTTAGRSTWKALIDGSSLQTNCNLEGFNIYLNNLNVRLGIISNNQDDCSSPDSYIGFGVSAAHVCGKSSNVTCGNIASCSGNDNGDKTTAAIGYILVE